MPTPASIRDRFPGVFDTTSDDSLNGAIAAAQQQVSPHIYNPVLLEEATLLLSCHFAELGKPSRAGGQHHGRAGLVEIDFGRTGGETSFWHLYQQMLKRVVIRLGYPGYP